MNKCNLNNSRGFYIYQARTKNPFVRHDKPINKSFLRADFPIRQLVEEQSSLVKSHYQAPLRTSVLCMKEYKQF
jgi:hypothetical protein